MPRRGNKHALVVPFTLAVQLAGSEAHLVGDTMPQTVATWKRVGVPSHAVLRAIGLETLHAALALYRRAGATEGVHA